MDMRRTLPALLLSALLPGCAWFGGGGGDESQGPAFLVLVHNSGSHDVQAEMEVTEGSRLAHEDAFVVEPGQTVERRVAYDQDGPRTVRLTYAVDSGGRAAAGSQEHTFDPGECAGTWRITFEVQPDEELTLVGNHAVCDAKA